MLDINIKNAKIGFDDRKVLFDNFNLKINHGEFVAILGKTGVGKTTLLRNIVGLNKLLDGCIEVKGSVSICFQDSRLFPHMNVYKNIAYPLIIKKYDKIKINNIVDEILIRMSIFDIKDRSVIDLSGGETKRVALARALVINPDILLLDEPTVNLDYEVKIGIREIIKSVHRNNNKTIIMVTHDILDALNLADKILILGENQIISFIDKNQIKSDEKAFSYLKPFFEEINGIKLL